MLNIYSRIEEIEKLLQHEDITGYRIEINTEEKNYLIDKPEQEQQHTNVIGFQIPSKNEHEERIGMNTTAVAITFIICLTIIIICSIGSKEK